MRNGDMSDEVIVNTLFYLFSCQQTFVENPSVLCTVLEVEYVDELRKSINN